MTARVFSPRKRRLCAATCAACVALVVMSALLHADQVEMQNGDRYFGKVVAMTGETMVLRSDVLGTVTLPRDQVAQVTFVAPMITNATRGAAFTNLFLRGTPLTNSNPHRLPALTKLTEGTNAVLHV